MIFTWVISREGDQEMSTDTIIWMIGATFVKPHSYKKAEPYAGEKVKPRSQGITLRIDDARQQIATHSTADS